MDENLPERIRNIFNILVEQYLVNGQPVGSKTLSLQLAENVSSATIRNNLSTLERMGLLYAPHTSAGRLPTPQGLKLFVEGILQTGKINSHDQEKLEEACTIHGLSFQQSINQAMKSLSGLAQCASLISLPSNEQIMKYIELLKLDNGKILAIMVNQQGVVENFILENIDIQQYQLTELSNYLNAKMMGKKFSEIAQTLSRDMADNQSQLHNMGDILVAKGLAEWVNKQEKQNLLIFHNHNAYIADDDSVHETLNTIKKLFAAIDQQEKLIKLCNELNSAENVQVYIGAHNDYFQHAGLSAVLKSFQQNDNQIIGTIGVIGPSRMNYARVIPVVDFTAKLMERMMK